MSDEFRKFHESSPDGISCGPSCVKMVASSLLHFRGKATNLPILAIREIMGTNSTTGTTEVEMARGLNFYDVNFIRNSPTSENGTKKIKELIQCLYRGDIALLRVLKCGYRHWIVATGIHGETIDILDPSEPGLRKWSIESVAKMMAPRGFEFWSMPPHQPSMRSINFIMLKDAIRNPADLQRIKSDIARISNDVELQKIDRYLNRIGPDFPQKKLSDFSLLLQDDTVVIAAHILRDASPEEVVNYHCGARKSAEFVQFCAKNKDQKMLESIAMPIDKEYSGYGVGRVMETAPAKVGYDIVQRLTDESDLPPFDQGGPRKTIINMGEKYYIAEPTKNLEPMSIATVSTAFDAEYPSI
jgi:hypothetical protein